MIRLAVREERFPIAGVFRISRESRTEARVVVAELSDGAYRGIGECVPYRRYGETVEGVMALITSVAADIEGGLDRVGLQSRLPAGAARNALDAAFWDLEAKRAGVRVWDLLGRPEPTPQTTCFTLSVDEPAVMGERAAEAAAQGRPLLKLKLGAPGDVARVAAVRQGAPGARIVADANEAWAAAELPALLPQFAALGVEMIEQPLPAGADDALSSLARPITLCADESCHGLEGLKALKPGYDMINIKLDKTGGLTAALALADAAEELGFMLMIGCMVGSSLAMAPATLLMDRARVVDLDGPLLLARDRVPGLSFAGHKIHPPEKTLWG